MPDPRPSVPARRRRDMAALGIETADAGTKSGIATPANFQQANQWLDVLEKIVEKKQELAVVEARQVFVEAAVRVARNIVKIAMGERKGATPTNEIEAGKLVLQYAGLDLKKAIDEGKKPLGEYSLTELESHLSTVAEQIQSIRAIPGESESIPD